MYVVFQNMTHVVIFSIFNSYKSIAVYFGTLRFKYPTFDYWTPAYFLLDPSCVYTISEYSNSVTFMLYYENMRGFEKD